AGFWKTRAAALAAASLGAILLIAGVLLFFPTRTPVQSAAHRDDPVPVERRFTDCGEGCPEMVVVPTGSFLMGSYDREPQRGNEEGPQHQVTISKVFAVGRHAVTFEQWDLCVAKGGCMPTPSDAKWGRGAQPKINASWNDAKDYVAWLSEH